MRNVLIFFLIILVTSCKSPEKDIQDIPKNEVVPSEEQIAYQKMELIGFIHFTVNTFTNKEWGYGDEDPAIFNPANLNTEQWAEVAESAGMKELILTAKHHDGFCLWPSKYTGHSIKNSPYKNGDGDIVKAFTKACRKHDIKPGLYLSPWDRHHAEYGNQEYITYYRNQLTELLTQYGKINEVWFDGANGGDGYYGGAREERTIDKTSYYEWDSTFKLVKELQPQAMIFSDAGPDVHWIGNEDGIAAKTFWSQMDTENMVIGGADPEYLNTGDSTGNKWVVGQCDVSIRPGWFYHPSEDSLVKSPQKLVDIYYKSVGRNAILLLNLPPDKRGLIHQNDRDSLKAFRSIIEETFNDNLAKNQEVTASNYRKEHPKFSPENITDTDKASYWATDDGMHSAELTVNLKEQQTFDRIMLQEPIRFGQRIKSFTISGYIDDTWETLASGTTIGYKRLLRIDPVKTGKVKITITDSKNIPALSNFGLFKASDREQL